MNQRELQELIKLVQEFTGTGDSGGNAGDGNNVTSQRSRWDDDDEIDFYTFQNIYGGDGGHYRKDSDNFNYNSQNKQGMFELKNFIKKTIKKINEGAYNDATLTTQGQARSRFTRTGMPPGIMENRAQELADSYSVEELNNQLKQLYRDMEQEAEPEGGPIANQYADEIYQYEEAIRIAKEIGGRGPSPQDKSYDEVYLKGKLVGMKDAYEYEVVRGEGRITIYPDLGSLQYKSRSTQEIVFSRGEGGVQFIRAFGYERSYYELKKVLPELPEMGDSSYAGFMNVYDKPIPVDIDTALEMIDAMIRGRDAESKAQSDFYGSRAQTGRIGYGLEEATNTDKKLLNKIEKKIIQILKKEGGAAGLDPIKKAVDKMNQPEKFNLKTTLKNMKNVKKHKNSDYILIPIEEQSDLESKAFQQGLKRLQKAVLNYQIRYFRKQRSKAISAAAKAGQDAGKGFDDQIKALKDQMQAIDSPDQGGDMNEISLVSQYLKERQHTNLMEHMDSYKNDVLLESTVSKFFEMFNNGKTTDEVLQYYASKGIKMPEAYIKKVKNQHESFQKLKLEIEMSEQESKEYTIPKAPDAVLFGEPEEEEPKEIASGILKTNLQERKYNLPPEVLDALKNTLKMNPTNRFIDKLKAVNSIPPSYKVFLHNGTTFDLIYEQFSFMVKIGSKEYYLNDIDEKNYCIQHINRLLTGPKHVPGEDDDIDSTSPAVGGGAPPPPPPPPPGDDMAMEEGEEPVYDAEYMGLDTYYADGVNRGMTDRYLK